MTALYITLYIISIFYVWAVNENLNRLTIKTISKTGSILFLFSIGYILWATISFIGFIISSVA